MNILPAIKLVASGASSLSAGLIVGNAIKATTPADLKRASKIAVAVGGVVLSTAAGELAATWVEGQIDQLAAAAKGFKDVVKEKVDEHVDVTEDEITIKRNTDEA